MLIFLFSKTTLFAFLVLCNVLGHSLLLKRFIKIEEDNYFFNFISGTISLIFFSYLINFFYPLNQYITNTFFFVFTLIGIYYVCK